ncbi:hypothetical protein ACP3TC_04935 [Winslowiella sp. 2C04]|uniref:hypothetical protein n=1 Tax=Winslowiella sp. 2C04 TaxID=3416179 RepID=UPI003CEC4FBB
MKYLLKTIIKELNNGAIEKFEIFSDFSSIGHYRKVPEGSCRILKYYFEPESTGFKLVNPDVNVQDLFDANQPKPNTWYSDGSDRVNIDMLINHLINN